MEYENNTLIIKPKGQLLKVEWDYKKQKFIEVEDITNKIGFYLNEITTVDTNITFKDILLLIKNNLSLCKIIIHNYIDEFLDEGFNKRNKKYNIHKYNSENIEYLELYKYISEDEPQLINYCHFHGIGVELQEAFEYHQKGQRINWSISMSKINNIINIPFKLNNNLKIYNTKWDVITEFKSKTSIFTLYDILYWTIWELSFYGNPTERNRKLKNLKSQVKKIKTGKNKIFKNICDSHNYERKLECKN